jgi:hypothetical protein
LKQFGCESTMARAPTRSASSCCDVRRSAGGAHILTRTPAGISQKCVTPCAYRLWRRFRIFKQCMPTATCDDWC